MGFAFVVAEVSRLLSDMERELADAFAAPRDVGPRMTREVDTPGYVEQALAKTLRAGDIVILDNPDDLGSHEGAAHRHGHAAGRR